MDANKTVMNTPQQQNTQASNKDDSVTQKNSESNTQIQNDSKESKSLEMKSADGTKIMQEKNDKSTNNAVKDNNEKNNAQEEDEEITETLVIQGSQDSVNNENIRKNNDHKNNNNENGDNTMVMDEEIARWLAQEQEREWKQQSDKASLKLVKKMQDFEQRGERIPIDSLLLLVNNASTANNNTNDPNVTVFASSSSSTPTTESVQKSTDKEGQFQDSDSALHAIVFLDLDNCPNELVDVYKIPDGVVVYMFGGPTLPKMPLTQLPELVALIQSRKLRIIHTHASARNAADFTLAFWCGVLHHRLPTSIPFLIVTRDKGIKNVLLQIMHCGRFGSIIPSNFLQYLHKSENLKNQHVVAQHEAENKEKPEKESTETVPETNPGGEKQQETAPTSSTAEKSSAPSASAASVNASSSSAAPTHAPAVSSNQTSGDLVLDEQVMILLDKLMKMPDDQRPRRLKAMSNFIGSAIKGVNEDYKMLLLNQLVIRNYVLKDDTKIHYFF